MPSRSCRPGTRLDVTAVVAALRAAGCVFAEDEAALVLASTDEPDALAALVARRVAGEPLEQVLGWAEFCGRHVGVTPGVFVPRRRTEALAEQSIARSRPGAVVVDLCCGSGAVAVVVAASVDGVEVHAADVDPAAVACARANLPGAFVHEGDLFAALPGGLRGRVDVLVANAPYVPASSLDLMPPEARNHEPPVAHDGGVDGLGVIRRIVAGAPEWLAAGGAVLLEVGATQIDAAVAALRTALLEPLVVEDEERAATVVVGTC